FTCLEFSRVPVRSEREQPLAELHARHATNRTAPSGHRSRPAPVQGRGTPGRRVGADASARGLPRPGGGDPPVLPPHSAVAPPPGRAHLAAASCVKAT